MKQARPVQNYVKLQTPAAGRCKYAFVDSGEHRADRILIGALIPASFERGLPAQATARASLSERASPGQDHGFELRICSFESKYEAWFLNCMADLAWVLVGDAACAGNAADAQAYARACRKLLDMVAAA